MQATAQINFQRRQSRRTSENLCPVKLRIIFNRTRKDYSIADKIKNNKWLYLSDSDIKSVTAKNPKGGYKDIANEYKRIVTIAEDIINDLNKFSFNLFEERYFDKSTKWDNVFSAMWAYIQDLKSEGRFGYASSFESTLKAVKEYHTGKKFSYNPRKDKVESREKDYTSGKALNFVDITPTWLKNFEKKLKEYKKSRSTIGIYMRNIRVIFNYAIKKHKVKAEYPFTDYTPKTASGRKIALTAQQISLIANYQTKHPQEQFYKDIFMFSFLANGMNLSDIARLRYSNIEDDEICFVRKKTEDEDEEDLLRVTIGNSMKAIINKHGNRAIGHDAYLFPILRPEWDEQRNYAEIKQLTKQVNKYIRRVADAIGIKEKISSYTARHSWATIAKNSGTSTEYIKEALGHSSLIVTQRYLKSFEKSTRKEHAEKMEDAIYKQKNVS
jgi:integrase/recombinase XerD